MVCFFAGLFVVLLEEDGVCVCLRVCVCWERSGQGLEEGRKDEETREEEERERERKERKKERQG